MTAASVPLPDPDVLALMRQAVGMVGVDGNAPDAPALHRRLADAIEWLDDAQAAQVAVAVAKEAAP